MKSLEADLLKTAAKEAKDGLVGRAANTMLISASYQEKDEKQLRDKLVTKLKQKAEDREDLNWNFFLVIFVINRNVMTGFINWLKVKE